MTSRPDMRYWPFEEWGNNERSARRMVNGTNKADVRWAVMGTSGSIPGCNGYAQIPWEGHPWTGIEDYNDLDDVSIHGGLTWGPHPSFDMAKMVREVNDATAGTDHPMDLPEREIPVHPATTFADCGGWIGFDTNHAWDYWPDEELERIGLSIHPRMIEIREMTHHHDQHCLHWTLEAVVAEAVALADQITVYGILAEANRKESDEGRQTKT